MVYSRKAMTILNSQTAEPFELAEPERFLGRRHTVTLGCVTLAMDFPNVIRAVVAAERTRPEVVTANVAPLLDGAMATTAVAEG
jgi:hypothetical protein